MYSSLQIIERLYNNYFGKVFWPVLLLCGVIAACIPFAICVSKWEVVSHDPRFLLMVFAFSIAWVVIFIGTSAGSTIYQRSMRFLGVIRQVNFKPNKRYFKRRVNSKYTLAIKVHDNFIDEKMPLSITSFCVDNIISLLVILKD